MKTTLDLEDELLIEAKAVAARRRTTLKAMVEHALRREIQPRDELPAETQGLLVRGDDGVVRLRKRGARITSEMIYKMLEMEEDQP